MADLTRDTAFADVVADAHFLELLRTTMKVPLVAQRDSPWDAEADFPPDLFVDGPGLHIAAAPQTPKLPAPLYAVRSQ